jgi:hypothetical protein
MMGLVINISAIGLVYSTARMHGYRECLYCAQRASPFQEAWPLDCPVGVV